MATAVENNSARPTNDGGWVEHQGAEIFKFEKRGDRLVGLLTHVEDRTITDKDTKESKVRREFTVVVNETETYKFLGNWDVVQKLGFQHRGRMVDITYVGDDEAAGREGNAMKVFKVLSKPLTKGAKVAGLGITDEDIPF